MLAIIVSILICLFLAKEKFSVRNFPAKENLKTLSTACGWHCRSTQMEFQLPEGGSLSLHPRAGEISKDPGLLWTAIPKELLLPCSAPAPATLEPSVSTGHEIEDDGRGKQKRRLNLEGHTRSLPRALRWTSRSLY